MVCVFQGFTSFGFGSNSHRVESTSWQRAPFFVKINYLFYFCILIAVSFFSLLPVTSSIHPSPSPLRSLRNCSHHSLLKHRGKLWIEFSQHFLIHRAWYLHLPQYSEVLLEKCLCTFTQGALDTYRSVVCISKSDQIWLFCFVLFCSVWCVFWTYLLWLLPLLLYDNLFQFYWMKTGISFLTYSSTFSTDKRKKNLKSYDKWILMPRIMAAWQVKQNTSGLTFHFFNGIFDQNNTWTKWHKDQNDKNIYEIMTPCTIEFIELVQIFRCSIANILFLL